jgi:aminoglycoside phosphotransferase (APT) family kinase protein
MNQEQTLSQLLDAIRIAAGNPAIEWAEPPQALTGGFWAQLLRVQLSGEPDLEGKLVARVMPDAAVGVRETMVQSHLAEHGFSTPAVRLSAGPTEQLDLAWMLMDLADGDPLIPNLSGASTLLRLPLLFRSMPDTLALCAADLHRIPSDGLAEKLSATDTTDEFLASRLEKALAMHEPELIELAESLSESRPAQVQSVICHGDLHPFNLLMGPRGYVALDWSTAQLADPCHDLAFAHMLLCNPPLEAPAALTPVLRTAGRALGRRFLNSYEQYSATTIDEERFEWFTRLQALRVFIEIATWKHAGETDTHSGHPLLMLEPALRDRYLGSQLAG